MRDEFGKVGGLGVEDDAVEFSVDDQDARCG